jgi:phosphoribosylformylglycinamidine synthase
MLYLRGCPSLSDFRKQKLLAQCRELVPALRDLRADYLHVVELDEALSSVERDILEKLLTYGPDRSAGDVAEAAVIVTPRPGTISPWSSKATDIVHNCGLERSRAWNAA